ncbi:M20/M25/M40 family metallo-hydrolase [Phreatobacter aquaticus]|uniref:M20/M25/M40 family metallo-hydrolase n=1 Tax=Phreatobacter aquaticus TaxID=2570229 RepID=A0A4D7QF99_9HYPH|nr:M20/M25/M40 family metallo-hydrolase [Phreatobacter aquaticus]QCK86610.1 M20/M25/M40 family metallo-hydrolase [Phreatobacter aquaticus]
MAGPDLDTILAAAAARRDQSLATLRGLIAAGRDGEAAVQALVAASATAAGAVVETVAYRPDDVPMVEEFADTGAIDTGERSCVVARLKGTGGGRSLIFFAHPDSEPVTSADRWRHDPFAGEIADGRIHGWGVADDLAGVAIMVEALAIVTAAGGRPAGDVILVSTPSKRHARGVSALMHQGLTADAAVYLHPAESGAGMGEIKALASGQVEFRVIVEGKAPPTTEPLQTGFAHLAENPIDKIMLIAAALQRLDVERAARVHHPALHGEVGRSTNLMLSDISAGDPDRLARVPATCRLGAALSFPPGEKLSAVVAEIEAAIAGAVAGDAWLTAHPPRIVWHSGTSAAEIAPAHPLFQVAAEAVARITGKPPIVNPMHTGSDIRNPIVQRGIPTIGLGPLCGDLSQNGSVDEWVDVEDYLRAVAVAAGIIAGWCGEG